jgi:predicted O-methyltransferase YrrM
MKRAPEVALTSIELHRTIRAQDIEARGAQALGTDFLSNRPAWVSGNISDYDSRFLAGLVSFANPRRLVEIGVASGWSSAVVLKALATADGQRTLAGIDLSPDYYLDPSIPTGRAVQDSVPDLAANYRLLTGRLAFDVMPEVGSIDFAFIDGHHMHPWATLDMLSVLPFLERGRWVAMHDLNLCTLERHAHRNRGPFYLFYMWPDQKLHSTQQPTMIGAVVLDRSPADYLPALLEILYTPWEVDVDPATLSRLGTFIGDNFGDGWRSKFSGAFECGRAPFSRPDEGSRESE